MRIAITNCVSQNGGDAAITFALYRRLRDAFPNASLECHDARPQVAAKYYPDITWKQGVSTLISGRRQVPRVDRGVVRAREIRFAPQLDGRWGGISHRLTTTSTERQILSDFRGIDVIVSTGGTYLVESYDLTQRFFEYRLAAAAGIPVVFFTQSLGPFFKSRNRRLARETFERTPLALLRDERSLQHLRDIEVSPERLCVSADAVFAEARPNITFPKVLTANTPNIGVSVRRFPPRAKMDHPQVRRFVAEMADGISRIVRELDASITFISTCQGVPEYTNDDSAVATAITDLLDEHTRKRVQVDRSFHTPEEYRRALEKFDLYISTRMHGAIQALIMGIPVIPIAYEYKTDELFTRLRLSDYVLDIETVTGALLASMLNRFVVRFPDLSDGLASHVEQQRLTAQRGIEMVCDVVQRMSGRSSDPVSGVGV